MITNLSAFLSNHSKEIVILIGQKLHPVKLRLEITRLFAAYCADMPKQSEIDDLMELVKTKYDLVEGTEKEQVVK